MKLDFRRNVRRNVLANAAGSAVKMLFPFLNRTLFLWFLGPAYLGLNGLFGSVLGVLMLAELGFGTAVTCSMYKPVADDDRALLCAYLRFYRTVYRCVGAAIFGLGLCLLPFLRVLVRGELPPGMDLHLLYLIHLCNTAASYFLFAYRGSVLGAHHRNDVVTNIRTGVFVAQYLVQFAVIVATRNYYFYVLSTVFFTVVQNVLLVVASRRLFPDVEPRGELPEKLRRRVVSDVKSIFLHKLGGVVTYQTDNLVVSAFLGLVAVAAYGNYYYVVTSVCGLAAIVNQSATGGFGNKIHTATKAENFSLLLRMNRVSMGVSIWCAAVMAALYQPFVALWTKGDPALLRHALTPALMVLYFYVFESRQMLLSFKSAAALWRQDRWKPVVAGVVNLGSNVAFVLLLPEAFKLDGVVFSTILGFLLVQMPWETRVVFRHFFGRAEERAWWRSQFSLAAFAAVLCAAVCAACSLVPGVGIAAFFAKAAVSSVLSAAGVLLFLPGLRLPCFWRPSFL